ncbi:MAG: VWA domain-containing protein, partial [Acidobacteria bacterium]|nr:VWA domain-containing protein [Acidobacteriota bacterium]
MTSTPIVRRLILIGLATAFGIQVSAQPRQTFRSATRLIEVPVIVTDRAGKPVTGLTQGDFTVTEDGVPQEIRFFEVRDLRTAPSQPVASATDRSAVNTFSNALPDSSGTATVILLDRLNASFDSQWFGREHIARYLRGLRPDDRTALYVLDGGIRVLHDFSNDPASLARALEIYQARVSGHYDASNEPAPDLG